MLSKECFVIDQNGEMQLQKVYNDATQKQQNHNTSNSSMFEQCFIYANTYYYNEDWISLR